MGEMNKQTRNKTKKQTKQSKTPGSGTIEFQS
jgi:hypothetical protein